jgi:tetratricopeptide (TPR) repeat protein
MIITQNSSLETVSSTGIANTNSGRSLIVRIGLFPIVLLAMLHLSGHAFSDDLIKQMRQQNASERAEAYLAEGKKALQTGDFIRAIRVLSAAIKRGAGPEAFRERGVAFYLDKKYSEAVTDLTRFLSSGSPAPADYTLRGDAFIAQQDYEKAIFDYQSAIQKDPLYTEAYLGRGLANTALEKYDCAIRDFQVVLETQPRNTEALINVGLACAYADLPTSARTFFSLARDIEPSTAGKQRIETLIASLPDKSTFEQHIGGLPGYLSASLSSTIDSQSLKKAPSATSRGLDGSSHIENDKRILGQLDLREVLNQAKSGSKNLAGMVAGNHMGFKWSLQFQSKGRFVSGVLKITAPSGHDETHTCNGTFDRGFVEASNQSGYRFHGRITENLRLLGVLTTNLGQSFSVDMQLEDR